MTAQRFSRCRSGGDDNHTWHTKFGLAQDRPSKTLDIGCNGTTVSADCFGTILQLSTYHPNHGIIVAAPYEQFDGDRFHDPAYVREYRAQMLKMVQLNRPGFGIRFDGQPSNVCLGIEDHDSAVFQFSPLEGVDVSLRLYVQTDGMVVQDAVITSHHCIETCIGYKLDLGLSLNRASYGQLTEGGPIPLPSSENQVCVRRNPPGVAVVNRHLGANILCSLADEKSWIPNDQVKEGTFRQIPVEANISSSIKLPPHSKKRLRATFRLSSDASLKLHSDGALLSIKPRHGKANEWRSASSEADYIIRRNLEYILGSCAIPVSESRVALLTDHVALPLGWNRDNYWQVRFLLDVHRNLDRFLYPRGVKRYGTAILKTVRGHLDWVFHQTSRPRGFWHRSYVVTGRPKDGPTYQLDQQCYPFLELCDFFDEFPEERQLVHDLLVSDAALEVISVIQSKQDPETGLFPTDETPADDAVEYPFHFSSHLLLWYTISRLCRLIQDLAPQSRWNCTALKTLCDDLRQTTIKYFTGVEPSTQISMFAYLTDGGNNQVFYLDANDIPTLYAPSWGFISSQAELQLWTNTMRFGLSSRNEGYYGSGEPFGGLGSVHTPAPWPLGYFQEYIFAKMKHDAEGEASAWERIMGSAQWDGSFSEAVSPQTGECTSKAWFSWPGAMIASAFLRSERVTSFIIDGCL